MTIVDKHDSIASVIVYLIVLDIDNRSDGHNAVVVVTDLILGN